MSNVFEWAKKELDLLVEEGDDMQQVVNDNILELIGVFEKQGHSGFSASYVINKLVRLLNFKPILPLTGDEDEWGEVFGESTQQNKRCSAVFREDFDNSTARYIEGKVFSSDGGKSWYTSSDSFIPVVFPFHVPDKPEYIILKDYREDEEDV